MADQTVLGLDIGTNRIKFVEARAGRQGPVITNAGVGLTPRDTIANGVIVDPDALGAALRQLLDQHGVKTKRVVSSVASQSSLVVRPIEVPRMTRQELADTMQWEVERHIPFAASEIVMDYQPLIPPEELPPDAQNMQVLLAVAQEDMVNAHVETLFRAGLDPAALDVEPLAASRALIDINRDRGSYEHTYALLNIGANTTDLSIVRNGLLTFTRPVPLAGDNITNAVAEALGYEFHEAERVKLEQGALYLEGRPALEAGRGGEAEPVERAAPEEEGEGRPKVFDLGADAGPGEPPEQRPRPPGGLPLLHSPTSGSPARQVYDAMLPTVVELVTEIRRSMEYFTNRYPDSRVDTILVYGGTARLRNFPEFLANEVGTAVELANPFARADLEGVSAEFVGENGPYMPIGVGLAMRDMLD